MDNYQLTKRMKLMPYLFGGLLGIALGFAILSGILFIRSSNSTPAAGYNDQSSQTSALPAAYSGSSIDDSRRNAIVNATEVIAPAVVSITTTYTEVYRRSLFFDEWFGRFYSQPRKRSRTTLGSGVIISEDGYILTNAHVVARAERITVTLSSGEVLEGDLLASAPEYDLALLKVEGRSLPFARLGDSEDLLVGEWVIAIGSPFGHLLEDPQPTVTVGVVSALHRDVRGEQASNTIFKDMIQTDAAINPGNSGGPLVNSRGEVIGINTFIFSGSGGSIGMGFAIPINRGKWVLDEISNYGRVRAVWVGITATSVTPEIAVGLNLDVRRGVLINSIEDDSPAHQAGLRPGDLILAVNGRPVTSVEAANRIIFGSRVGDKLTFDVNRRGKELRRTLTLEERPSDT
jgi:serine protease Do